jgi:GTP:adenosylcobinamide-phosphate guanylyltransferase
VDIAGKPMVQWVLDALCGAKHIEKIVIIGLPSDINFRCDKALAYIPSHEGMLDNIRAGAAKLLETNPSMEHVLIVSADIPAISAESVDWVVEAALQTDEDAYYNVITRQVMEARYPTSRRSYAKFKDVEVCGGDMNVVRTSLVLGKRDFWDRLVDSRKSVFKQAALIGYDTLILLLLRQITLEGAVDKVTRRLNLTGRAIPCPFAEVGMDVDKPHQLEILRADLTNQT